MNESKKLWMLLKIQWYLLWHPTRENVPAKKEKAQLKPMLGQKKRTLSAPQARRNGGMPVAVVAIILVISVLSISVPIAFLLQATNLLYLLLAITMAASSMVVMVTTIYKINGLLFGFKDYDLVMSLPIKTSTVITTRMLILYGYNLFFTLVIMVPTGVVYAIFAQPPAGFYPLFVIATLMIPLVPVVVAALIGTLIAFVASHFKKRAGVSVVFTVAVMMVWIVFCMNISSFVRDFTTIGPEVVSVINQVYPLTLWYTNAVCNLDIPAFLLFAAVSLGVFALFVLVVGKFFKRLNSSITANRAAADYKMRELKTASPKMALFKKEWKRFTGSSAYFLNAGIGAILLIAVAVLMAVFGAQNVMKFVGVADDTARGALMSMLATVMPMGMAFFVIMIDPSASAVSIEGKNLWIIKSLPVTTEDILRAKLQVNMVLVAIAVVVSGTIFNILLKVNVLQGLMMYLTPMVYGFFGATLGLKLDLRYPRLDWDSEVMVVKQGTPVMVVVLGGMALTIVPAVLSFILGSMVVYIATLALAGLALLLYKAIMNKGVAQFNAL